MRWFRLLLVLLCIASSGCVILGEPIYVEKQTVNQSQIVGVWEQVLHPLFGIQVVLPVVAIFLVGLAMVVKLRLRRLPKSSLRDGR